MPSEPVYLRWENTTSPHRKFYEVEVELSLFYPKVLVRRWGRIGTRQPRSIRRLMPDAEELQELVGFIRRRRRQHGYRMVTEMWTSAIEAPAA